MLMWEVLHYTRGLNRPTHNVEVCYSAKLELELSLSPSTEALESEIHKYGSLETSITIAQFPEIAVTENDNPALKITVNIACVNGRRNNCIDENTKGCIACFNGFLLSVGSEEDILEKQRLEKDEAMILPLLLVEYTDKIFLKIFFNFLEENFSCIVSPLKFSSSDLKWMLTLFTSPVKEKLPKLTVLVYETPIEELKTIEYLIDSESMTKAWNKVSAPGTSELTEDIVDNFISVLEGHFYEMFQINLSCLQLCVIGTPEGQVHGGHSNHMVKLCESKKIYFILKHLTELAQEMEK